MYYETFFIELINNPWFYPLLLMYFKASFILLFAIFIHHQMKLSSAAHRSFLCSITFIALIALPSSALLMPEINLPVLPATTDHSITNTMNTHSTTLTNNTIQNGASPVKLSYFLYFYLSITILLSIRLVLGLYRVATISKERESANASSSHIDDLLEGLKVGFGIQRQIKLIVSEHIDTPFTYGFLKPIIVWPAGAENWSLRAKKCALAHELAHIKRADWLRLLIGHIACILFWALPFSWMFAKQQSFDAERAADDLVLNHGIKASFYADQLLQFVQNDQKQKQELASIALLQPTAVFDRIKAIIDVRQNREMVSRLSFFSYTIPATTFLFLVASINTTAIAKTNQALEGLWLYKLTISPNENQKENKFHPSEIKTFDLDEIKLSAKYPAAQPTPIKQTHAMEKLVVTGFPAKNRFRVSNNKLPITIPAVKIEGYLPSQTITPAYPKQAIRQGIEGYVVARFSIDGQGKPYNIKILEAKPSNIFNQSVRSALGNSRYIPHTINKQRISIKGVTTKILFKLTKEESPKRAYAWHERSPPLSR